jgi:protease IV
MKPFFKEVLKHFAVTAVSTLVFVCLSAILLSAIISSMLMESEVPVKKGSFLVLDLSMNLTDRPSGVRFEDLTRQALVNETKPPHFHLLEVLRTLDKAAEDEKITGIFIEGGFMPSGYGCGYEAVSELVDSLRSFKKSGKPIIGFCHTPDQLDYLVYSVCDELYMDPAGTLLLSGLASGEIFLGETFEKYGVGIQVVRVGEFKGAVEPLTSTSYSEENRMQIKRLLDLRWEHYLNAIALNRAISLDFTDFNETLGRGFLLEPQQAVNLELVDSIAPYDQMLDQLLKRGSLDSDTNEYSRVYLHDYVDRPNTPEEAEVIKDNGIPKVAVLYVEGSIVDGWADDGFSVGGNEIADRIREIRKDPQYKALVIRVNSPGGSVSGSDAILSEITRARKDGLPVVVSMGSVAASGGYWISTASDRIFAGEQTITGSIGVFGLMPNVKELGARFGLHWDVVKTHESSDLMGVSRPKTKKEIDVIQGHVDRIYSRFINLVATSRSKEIPEIEEIAQGRVWMGKDAMKIGLIDEYGGIVRSIEYAAGLAELKHGFDVVEFPRVGTPFDALAEAFQVAATQGSSGKRSIGRNFRAVIENLQLLMETLSRLNDPGHVYSILPWYSGSFGF